MKRLPTNSVSLLLKFDTEENLNDFLNDTDFLKVYGALSILSKDCNNKKIEFVWSST